MKFRCLTFHANWNILHRCWQRKSSESILQRERKTGWHPWLRPQSWPVGFIHPVLSKCVVYSFTSQHIYSRGHTFLALLHFYSLYLTFLFHQQQQKNSCISHSIYSSFSAYRALCQPFTTRKLSNIFDKIKFSFIWQSCMSYKCKPNQFCFWNSFYLPFLLLFPNSNLDMDHQQASSGGMQE